MTIRSFKLGPGTLTVGTGSPREMNMQLKNARIEWSEAVTADDNVDVLSGESLIGSESATYTAKLAGSVLQDLESTGLLAWSWTNKGVELPFTFTPRTDTVAKAVGTVRVAPLNLGGDVKSRPESDFSWACVGTLPAMSFV